MSKFFALTVAATMTASPAFALISPNSMTMNGLMMNGWITQNGLDVERHFPVEWPLPTRYHYVERDQFLNGDHVERHCLLNGINVTAIRGLSLGLDGSLDTCTGMTNWRCADAQCVELDASPRAYTSEPRIAKRIPCGIVTIVAIAALTSTALAGPSNAVELKSIETEGAAPKSWQGHA